MERKKVYLIAIVTILAITMVSFGIVTIKKFIVQKKQQAKEQKVDNTLKGVINKTLPKIACNFNDDAAATSKAIEEKDSMVCICVKNDKSKTDCQKAVVDLNYLEQARQQYDLSTCQKITNPEIADSCKTIVGSGVRELRLNNPELLAYLYSQQNNFDGSIKLLNDELAKNPSDVDAILNLAVTYAGRAIAEHKESEYVPKAFDLVNNAIKLNPNNPEAYRVQGYINEAKTDYYAAIDSYNKSLELDKNYVFSYIGRGHTYNLRGELENALADFKKAKELDKDKKNPEIYSNLCRLEASSPYIDDAIDNCKIAINLPSSNLSTRSGAYGVLGEMYIRTERYDEAEAQINLALASNPNDANTYVILAKLNNLKGDYDLALSNANKAIKIDSLKSSAYGYIAEALFKKGRLDDSIAAGLKGLDLVEKDISLLLSNKPTVKKEIYNVLAQAYGKKGDKMNADKYSGLADGIK